MTHALTPPILYSYRRCPYAMRARMALFSAQIQCEVHDIDFKNKPAEMLKISPKGTVPVLHLDADHVIEESLEIMKWSLKGDHPLMQCDMTQADTLISVNDGRFKSSLDRYKYPDRFEGEDCSNAKQDAFEFLKDLNDRLRGQKNLISNAPSIADIAIFPFIRQFANVDRDWFALQPVKPLQEWLERHIESDLFQAIFKKQKENPYLLIR